MCRFCRKEKSMARPPLPEAMNLAKILFVLMTRPRGWRIDQLREELGIAERTYRKYRRALQDHFDYLMDAKGKSRIVEEPDGDAKYLRIREVDDEDRRHLLPPIISLHMARLMFGFLERTSIGQYLSEHLAESMRAVGDRAFVGHLFRDLDRMIYAVPNAPKDYSKKGEEITAILNGLFFRRVIAFDYLGLGKKEPARYLVEPYTLTLHRSSLYLIARPPTSREPITFAIDRLKNVSATDQRFDYPTGYSPEKYFEGCFGIFRGQKDKRQEVELVFIADQSLHRSLLERQWIKSQKFQVQKDGCLKMSFKVRSLEEVVPWVRSFGNSVKMIKPKIDMDEFVYGL
jgi:predicted DNA-binding transcriptional regulator YafY